jgi:TonB family protein
VETKKITGAWRSFADLRCCLTRKPVRYDEVDSVLRIHVMNGSVSRTLRAIKRSAVFAGAIGLFFSANSMIGETGGSRSTPAGSSEIVNDSAPPSGPLYQPLAVELLSDTQGVDFAPYVKQVLQIIGKSWHSSLPGEAAYAKGAQADTTIRFTISQDGTVSAMQLVESAHQLKLDRAAWGSITGVGKLPSLPADFSGPSLIIRVHFKVSPAQQ